MNRHSIWWWREIEVVVKGRRTKWRCWREQKGRVAQKKEGRRLAVVYVARLQTITRGTTCSFSYAHKNIAPLSCCCFLFPTNKEPMLLAPFIIRILPILHISFGGTYTQPIFSSVIEKVQSESKVRVKWRLENWIKYPGGERARAATPSTAATILLFCIIYTTMGEKIPWSWDFIPKLSLVEYTKESSWKQQH